MSKRKNLERRRKTKLAKHAHNIVNNLTPEQQDRLAELLAKAVTDATPNNPATSETTGK